MGCSERCSRIKASRTPQEWRWLIGSYALFYLFMGCFMAIMMAIFVSTTPDTAAFRNGNFELGDPTYSGLLLGRVSLDRPVTAECDGTFPCTQSREIKINTQFALRELRQSGLTITCTPRAPAILSFSNCALPTRITDDATIVQDLRTCTAGATLTANFAQGALAPFVFAFDATATEEGSHVMDCILSVDAGVQQVIDNFATLEYEFALGFAA
eukprot:m.479145 g.479145  ORF g.479145 m.479145 type:complete len:213 (-) comp21335_c0_seq1:166-804(-)